MTLFSTLLAAHIKNKNIRTYPLAQYCGIDRSNMYKLINGKRNPPSEAVVHKMSDFMKLTRPEHKELLEAYEITITGYETYYRRKNVQEFFSHFSDKAKKLPDVSPCFTTTFRIPDNSDSISFSGKTDLNQAIYSILAAESQNPEGCIKLLLQPDSGYFMEILSYIGKNNCNLTIEHIICLNNNDNITTDKRDYNLSCLQKIIPMYSTCPCNYIPLYYYDSIISHNSIFNLLSSMIVTSRHAFTFSPTLQYGILFTRKQTLQRFHTIFNDLRSETTPIVCKIDSIFTQLNYFDNLALGESMGFSFQQEPCVIPLMPLSFPEKYLIGSLQDRSSFLESVTQYIQKQSDILKASPTQFSFTEKGVLNFLKTGRLFELPDSIYRPLEYSDRILIIRNLINACKNQNYRMMHPDAPIADSNLCTYVTSRNGYLLFAAADGKLVYLNLEEPSLLLAFYDYLGALGNEFYYTSEETVEILRKLLKERP